MTERLNELKIQYVEVMPDKKEAGILYISKTYQIAIHLCACGCGLETVTPFNKPHGWQLTEQDGKVTLSPSIGNQNFPCKSHYFIRDNMVKWV